MKEGTKLELLSIAELSAATGCPPETIRFYERQGLVSAPPRTVGGRRIYRPSHLRQLEFVLRARALGFSLDRIRLLARLAERGDRHQPQAQAIAEAHWNELQFSIGRMQRLATQLSELIKQCPAEGGDKCPIIAYLNGERSAQ